MQILNFQKIYDFVIYVIYLFPRNMIIYNSYTSNTHKSHPIFCHYYQIETVFFPIF